VYVIVRSYCVFVQSIAAFESLATDSDDSLSTDSPETHVTGRDSRYQWGLHALPAVRHGHLPSTPHSTLPD
jgi:hypothetical protein